MKKAFICVILLLSLFFLPSCTGKNEPRSASGIITQEDALDLAKQKYGETDTETGSIFMWDFMGTIKIENVEYYDFKLLLMAQNEEGTLSGTQYVKNVIISKDGSSIKEYTENSDNDKR